MLVVLFSCFVVMIDGADCLRFEERIPFVRIWIDV